MTSEKENPDQGIIDTAPSNSEKGPATPENVETGHLPASEEEFEPIVTPKTWVVVTVRFTGTLQLIISMTDELIDTFNWLWPFLLANSSSVCDRN